MLRGSEPARFGADELNRLAAEIKDNNYRIFAEDGQVHVVSAGLHLADADPFVLCEQLLAKQPRNLDAGHAFYLGYEMAKAVTALTLAKDYRQDEALDWGYLTRRRAEPSAEASIAKAPDNISPPTDPPSTDPPPTPAPP